MSAAVAHSRRHSAPPGETSARYARPAAAVPAQRGAPSATHTTHADAPRRRRTRAYHDHQIARASASTTPAASHVTRGREVSPAHSKSAANARRGAQCGCEASINRRRSYAMYAADRCAQGPPSACRQWAPAGACVSAREVSPPYTSSHAEAVAAAAGDSALAAHARRKRKTDMAEWNRTEHH